MTGIFDWRFEPIDLNVQKRRAGERYSKVPQVKPLLRTKHGLAMGAWFRTAFSPQTP